MTWISNAATFGKLWFVIAALLSVVGGPRGRRTAARSLLAYGATSLIADASLKMLMLRRRPGRENVESSRDIRVPTSVRSFPSGHAASAFAFAAAASTESPLLALPLFGVASLIGYSRVPRRRALSERCPCGRGRRTHHWDRRARSNVARGTAEAATARLILPSIAFL